MSFDKFASRHIGPDAAQLREMLDVIGVKSKEELISQVIPQSIRLRRLLALPKEGMDEYHFEELIRSLAEKNHPLR